MTAGRALWFWSSVAFHSVPAHYIYEFKSKLLFVFYGVFAHVRSKWSPFWIFYIAFYSASRNEAQGAHVILGLKCNLRPSFKAIGVRSVALA